MHVREREGHALARTDGPRAVHVSPRRGGGEAEGDQDADEGGHRASHTAIVPADGPYPPPMVVPPERVRLADGGEVEIRPIEPADATPLSEGLEALSADSRYRRFLAPKRAFSASELGYLTKVDHVAHEALVAVDPRTAHCLGVARFVKDPADASRAEMAIVVADDWQGRGVGTALLHRLADRAAVEGIRHFRASVLESNHDVVILLRKAGPIDVRHPGGGVAELTIHLHEGEPCPPAVREALRAAARGELELA